MGGDIVTKKIVEKNNTSLDFQILGKRRGTCIISTEIQLRHTQKKGILKCEKNYSNVKFLACVRPHPLLGNSEIIWNFKHLVNHIAECRFYPKHRKIHHKNLQHIGIKMTQIQNWLLWSSDMKKMNARMTLATKRRVARVESVLARPSVLTIPAWSVNWFFFCHWKFVFGNYFGLPNFLPQLANFFIRNIRDIFHLWNYVVFLGAKNSREKSSLTNLWTHFRHGCGLAVDGGASLDWRECRLLKPLLSPWLHPAHCSDDHNQANNWPIFSPKLPFWSKVASFALKYQTHWVNSRSQGDD